MELERLKEWWNALGEQDPLSATLPRLGERVDSRDLETFFASGRREVDEVLQTVSDRGVAVEMGRVLDFGCGVGRLTRALAEHFDSCDGVDVAASMIRFAREFNHDLERLRFHHNDTPDLRLFGDGSFDFVLALHVLEHMEPHLVRDYLGEFLRVLRPGGVAFFNIPEPKSQEDVVAAVQDGSGVVLCVIAKDRGDPSMKDVDYLVARAVAPAAAASREERNSQGFIQAQIREGLEGRGHSSRDRDLVAADQRASDRRRWTLHLLDERADLIGFALTSTLKGVGRASNALRGALRRGLLEVLHRQTEHNRASDELLHDHEARIEALGATIRAQLDIQGATDTRLDAFERRLAPVEVNSVTLARRQTRGAMRPDLDYLAFAERFYGTAEEIRERRRRYLPRFAGRSDVIDLGCGRGEFLELLRETGATAVGVDVDAAMIRRCRELGLEAVQGDAVHFLAGRPQESSDGIIAAHLVEHLDRGEVVELVRFAFSRLRPGGVLVIETVNPMCLLTHATLYEFTRVEPSPPLALKWLAESCGYTDVEIEYISPVPDEDKLRPLLASVGPDADVDAFNRGVAAANELLFGFRGYALVAGKPT